MNKTRPYKLALLATGVMALAAQQSALAGDFSHAKKIFVPASRIDRRLDYNALGEREASVPGGSSSSSSGTEALIRHRTTPASLSLQSKTTAITSSIPTGGSAMPSAAGLVPPPPPLAPSILSASASGAVAVPPPPRAQSLSLASPKTPSSTHKIKTAAQPAKTATPESGVHARSQKLIKEGKIDEADSLLRSAYKQDPKNTLITNDLSSLSVERGKKLFAEKDLDGAARAAREALFVNPGSSQAGALLDDVLKQSGINPGDAIERAKLGDLLASQGRETAAKVEYKQSLKLKPNAQSHVGLGNLALRQENKALAKHEYQTALEIDPNSALAHRQAGILRLSQGDNVGANADLSRAVILDPTDKVAGKSLTELWQRQTSKNPGDSNSHLGLARAYQLTGDLKSAQAEYRQVVRIDPNNPNLPAARQAFKLAMARQESDRSFTAARTLDTQGATAAAAEKVNEALAINPTSVPLRLYQGNLLEKMGQMPQARDAYMSVLKEDPTNVQAAQRLTVLSGGPPQLRATPMAMGAQGAPLGLAPPAGEAPPAAMLPGPQDQVSSLSNFLVSLRNHGLSEQQRMKDIETNTHKALETIKNPAAASAPPPAPTGVEAGANSALASAASALAAAGVGSAATMAGSALSGGPAQAPAQLAAATQSFVPPTAPQMTAQNALPMAAPALDPRMQALEKHNRFLQQQLAQAQQALNQSSPARVSQMPQTAQPGFTNAQAAFQPSPQPMPQMAQAMPQAAARNPAPPSAHHPFSQPVPTSAMPMPQPMQPYQAAPMQQQPQQMAYAPPAAAPGQTLPPPYQPFNPQAGMPSMAPPPMPLPASVHLELTGFTPGKSDVQLKVLLRNNQNQELALPAHPTAVIKNGGGPEVHVKASFPAKSVPPHGQVEGTIRVPRKNVDASSDLFLQDVLPAGTAYRHVHLTTPVSYRQ